MSNDMLELSAPLLPDTLRLPLAPRGNEALAEVSVWRDAFPARDEGEAAAQWFSRAIQAPVRLVRFDPSVVRYASRQWTGSAESPVQFADGFPLLVTSEASLAEVNRRLALKGAPAIPMDRFRPNLVLRGLEAFDEDFIDTVSVGDNVVLRFVKPCARCPITTVDQSNGKHDSNWPHEPLDTLAGWRVDARVDGGLTFGQNAIVVAGAGARLRAGVDAHCEWNFPQTI